MDYFVSFFGYFVGCSVCLLTMTDESMWSQVQLWKPESLFLIIRLHYFPPAVWLFNSLGIVHCMLTVPGLIYCTEGISTNSSVFHYVSCSSEYLHCISSCFFPTCLLHSFQRTVNPRDICFLQGTASSSSWAVGDINKEKQFYILVSVVA